LFSLNHLAELSYLDPDIALITPEPIQYIGVPAGNMTVGLEKAWPDAGGRPDAMLVRLPAADAAKMFPLVAFGAS
jgi:hypothetical protein